MTGRFVLLVLAAALVVAAAFAYGLESPAVYDAELATYYYPRRPYRGLVLAAGIAIGAAAMIGAFRGRPKLRRAA